MGFEVARLGWEDEPLTTDVYLLRDDRQRRTGFLVPEGSSAARFGGDDEASLVLPSTPEGLYVPFPRTAWSTATTSRSSVMVTLSSSSLTLVFSERPRQPGRLPD